MSRSPELEYYLDAERARQIDVFGVRRIAELAGREATPDTTERFLGYVNSLCQIEAEQNRRQGIGYLALYRERDEANEFLRAERTSEPTDGMYGRKFVRPAHPFYPLVLSVNPEDAHGFGSGETDRSPACAHKLTIESRIMKPGHMPLGKYLAIEDVYIDRTTGSAKVYRRLEPIITLGGTYGNGSDKDATEAEVIGALDIIAVVVDAEPVAQAS